MCSYYVAVSEDSLIRTAEAIPTTHFASEVTFDNFTVDNDDQSVDGSIMQQSSYYRDHDVESMSMTESRVFLHTTNEEDAAQEGYGLPESEEEHNVSKVLKSLFGYISVLCVYM